MAKRNKKGRVSKTPPPRPKKPPAQKGSRWPLLALFAGAALLVVGGYYFFQGRQAMRPTGVQNATSGKVIAGLRETRPTLSPDMFSGKVRRAYAIARDIPQVLDQLYCYCRCRENFGHKSLLTCYVDKHAST